MHSKVNRFPGSRVDKPLPWILAAVLLAVLSACSLHPGRGLKSCRYRFQGFTFLGMDAGQTHWRVDVAVTNPNKHAVTLTRMHYALFYGADTLLSGWNPEKKEVPAKDSTVLTTTVDLPNTVFMRLPLGIWSQTDARFPFTADAYLHTWVGDIQVPQAIRETVHINMAAQVSKYRDMLMHRFFTWPGKHMEDDGIQAPDAGPPRDGPPPQAPVEPQPDASTPPDEHL